MPVLAAAIGIYLPLETMVPIFIGGLLNYLVTRTFGKGLSEDETEKRNRKGTLFAAGLITGEALMGIIIGFIIYFANRGVARRAPKCSRCQSRCRFPDRRANGWASRCSAWCAGGCTASGRASRHSQALAPKEIAALEAGKRGVVPMLVD